MKGVMFVCVFLISTVAHADGVTSEKNFRLQMAENGRMYISGGGGTRKISLAHEVFGYEVNCAKTWLLVWGKPKNLNENNPQDSILTIFNLKSHGKPITIGFGKNIFDAVFLKDGVTAIVGSDSEVPVDIIRGKLLGAKYSASSDVNSGSEVCTDFPYKSYRKYKN